MAVGPFLSVDTGFANLLGTKDFTSTNIAVCLVTDAASAAITRAGMTYSDISANLTTALAIATPAVTVNSQKARFTHAKALFTEDSSLDGRYVFYVLGDSASLQASDPIFGYVDLTEDGNASSVNAEFSFTPHATNGLFEVTRSAGV